MIPFRFVRSKALLLLVMIAGSLPFGDAEAAGVSWNGGSGNWDTPASWTGGFPTNNATFVNSGTAGGTITLSGTDTAASLTFDLSAGSYTLSSGTLTMAGNDTVSIAATFAGSNVTELINSAVNMSGASLNMNNNSAVASDVLVVGGAVSNVGSAATLNLGGVNTGANTIGGNIVQGVNTLSLTKTGSGTWALSGNNSYSGQTTVNGGTLILAGSNALDINNAYALGSSGSTFTVTTGTIDNTSGAAIAVASNPIKITGNLTYGGSSGLNMGSGSVAVYFSSSITPQTITLNGTGSVLTFGGTFVQMNDNSDYLIVNCSGNTLQIGGLALDSNAAGTTARTQTIEGSANVIITGPITNGADTKPQSFAYAGSGVLTLDGSNTVNGTTYVNAGTVNLAGSISGSSNIISMGGGTLTYTATGPAIQTFGGLTVAAGASEMNVSSTTATIVLGGATITRAAGGTIDFGATSNIFATSTNNTDGIMGGYATVGGATWAVLPSTSGGAITGLSGSSYYAADNSTGIDATGNNDFQQSNPVAYGSFTLNSLRFSTGATTLTIAASGTMTVINGGILLTSNIGVGNPTEITGGSLEGVFNTDLVIINNSPSGLTIGSAIVDNTRATPLTIAGDGITVFTGSNTYTGKTYIESGILNYQNSLALAGSSAITVANGATAQVQGGITGGTNAMTINGAGAASLNATGALENVSGVNSYPGLLTLAGPSTISSDAGILTLSNMGTITGSGYNLTLNGAGNGVVAGIIGTGVSGLIKNGIGTWMLTAANTYTGATTVNAGILNIGNGGATGSISASSPLVMGGGTLTYTATGSSGNTQTFNSLTVNAGASQVNETSVTGTIALGAIASRNVGGTIDFGASSSITTTSTNNSNGILGGYATAGGTTWAVLPSSGGGLITGLAAAGYNTSNSVTASAPGATANADFQASNSTAWPTGSVNSLRFNTGATTLTLATTGTLTLASGGLLLTSNIGNGNATTITGGVLEGMTSSDLTIINNSPGGLTIGSVIANNLSSTGLTISGAGTTTLTAANTYTGVTTVNGGTLQLNGSLAAGSAVGIGAAATLTGTGTINGGATLKGNGIINLGATGRIGGSLTVNGGNWNGQGTVAGAVNIIGGILNIGPGASLPAGGGFNVTAGSISSTDTTGTLTGSVNYTSPASGIFQGVIAGANNTLTLNNPAATLILGGVNTYSGATTINAGSLCVNGSIAPGSPVNIGSAGALTGAGTINGSASMTGNGTAPNSPASVPAPRLSGATESIVNTSPPRNLPVLSSSRSCCLSKMDWTPPGASAIR